jgi:2-desacetyl-2-hydroxyethyl bacteriochlorophyllide A dehydrogenase
MKANALFFTGPRRVELGEVNLPDPADGQLLVRTTYSGISSGSELLAYRGEIDRNLPIDEMLPALSGTFDFPFQYGYSCVGIVERSYADVPKGSPVFAFHPHQDRFVIDADETLPVTVDASVATLYPLVETALQVCVDAAPEPGATVVVMGQGAVGILAALLLQTAGARVLASEPKAGHRKIAESLGIETVEPSELGDAVANATSGSGVSLVVEASGNATALADSLPLLEVDGVVIVCSWYGTKRVALDLGAHFHRRRLTIRSSQVSTLGPSSRVWDRRRRTGLALRFMQELPLDALVTHEYSFERAANAYAALDHGEDGLIHANLVYE